jgi:ABC-type transport system involved in multi-copper enzyme maturation permease subunit
VRILALARFTFHETIRRRIAIAALLLTLLFLALFALGTHYAVQELEMSRIIVPSMKPVLVSQLLLVGMWIVSLSSGLLAIFSASGTISAEVDNATLHAIAAKPLPRWQIVVGKWLGLAGMLVAYTVVVLGCVIAIVSVRAGYSGSAPLLALLALSMQTLVLLSLTVLGSTWLPSLATSIAVFLAHAIAMAAGVGEQIGFLLKNQTMQDAGVWVSIAIPSDAMEKLAAAGLQASTGATLVMPGPFSVLSPPSPWMVAYATLYLVLCVLLAVARFDAQDL